MRLNEMKLNDQMVSLIVSLFKLKLNFLNHKEGYGLSVSHHNLDEFDLDCIHF